MNINVSNSLFCYFQNITKYFLRQILKIQLFLQSLGPYIFLHQSIGESLASVEHSGTWQNLQRRKLSKAQFCLQELRLICSLFWWKANGNNLMHFQQKENFCLSIKNFIHSSHSKKNSSTTTKNHHDTFVVM